MSFFVVFFVYQPGPHHGVLNDHFTRIKRGMVAGRKGIAGVGVSGWGVPLLLFCWWLELLQKTGVEITTIQQW